MAVTRYNAKDWVVTVAGVNITGLGEDMISFEKEEAFFEPAVGAQGDIVKNEINNSIYNMGVIVQPTSPQLSHLLSLKNRSESFPIWAVSKALGIRLGGTMANISEMPELSFGAEAEDIEITFMVFDGVVQA